jgi:tetratricopeptide (TPR) repeat protein
MFVGRADQMDEMDRLVLAGARVVAAQAVHGLGGVGKSELVLQYADRHRNRYRVVWWVQAETPETVEAGLAQLAFRLHPGVQVIANQVEAATWALGWLQSHDGWLLVLDNVEHRSHVEPLLGQLSRGHVLITTRRDVSWEDITDGCLRLDVLHPDAAVALLTRGSGQVDGGTAGVLAGELGCLPLALTQAAAYIQHTRVSIEDYLEQLRDDPARILETVSAGDNAQRAVARTWSITVTTIAGDNPLAIRVLQILSCLAPDEVPRDVFRSLADMNDVNEALGLLSSHSIVTLTDTAVTVHRLVQAVTLDQLRQQPAQRDDALHTAVDLLNQAQPKEPPDSVAGWPRRAALRPHVAALAALCPDYLGGEDLAGLLATTGFYEWTQGRYRQALNHEQRALAITETILGPDHPVVGIRLNNLAGSLRALGRPGEAEPLHRRALPISVAAYGPDHPTVSTALGNLGLSLLDLQRPEEAEPLFRRALAISEASDGSDDSLVSTSLGNLGGSLIELQRPGEAEPLFRRALAISEAAHGPDHPEVAVRLDNLAICLQDLDRAGEAEPLHRRALAIGQATLDPNHPQQAYRMGNLAVCLQDLDRPGEAEPLFRRALAITETTLGPDHPDLATGLLNLAMCLEALGRATEAEPLRQRALAMHMEVT